MYDYNARYYSAVLGRFVSPDSIVPEPGSSGGFNRYRYTRNNPLKYTDPSGHQGEPWYEKLANSIQQLIDDVQQWWSLNNSCTLSVSCTAVPQLEPKPPQLEDIVGPLLIDPEELDAVDAFQEGAEAGEQLGQLFPNNMPGSLNDELARAGELGVEPIGPSDPGFEDIVNGGTVKWAVNADGELVVTPKFVDGEEISHTVLTQGGPVRAAGEADIAGSGGEFFGIDINNHSGHFEPSEKSLKIGREAFKKYGINFPEEPR